MAQLDSFTFSVQHKINHCHLEEVGNMKDPSYTIYFNYEVKIDETKHQLTTYWIHFDKDKERAEDIFKSLKSIFTAEYSK